MQCEYYLLGTGISEVSLHNGIENIDHPVIASADLDTTRQQFERLGFTVPSRGSHIEWGTGNLCIMFPDDYIEVRGIIDPDKFTMHLDTHRVSGSLDSSVGSTHGACRVSPAAGTGNRADDHRVCAG